METTEPSPSPHALRVYRQLCLLAAGLILVLWLVRNWTGTLGTDPLAVRLAMAAAVLAPALLSYRVAWVRRHFRASLYGLLYVLIAWAVGTVAANHFETTYTFFLFLVIASIGLGGGVSSQTARALIGPFVFCGGLVLIALWLDPTPALPREQIAGTALLELFVVYLAAHSRIDALARLRNSETRYRAVVQQSHDGIYLLDPETLGFLDANLAYCALIGYDLDALKTMTVFDVALEQADTLLDAAADVNTTGEFVSGERRHRRADSSVIDVHVSASLIHYGTRNAICVVARDVSGQRRHERELLRAKEQAEEMLRLKTAFLSNMSHELRTPLTAILGFAEILAEEVDGEQREYVEVIEQGAQRLYATLNSVLDLAQLEGGTISLNSEAVDLGKEAQGVVDLLRALATQKDLVLRFIPPSPPVCVQADPSALRRVLTNLIGNAIKFTERGTVTVQLGIGGKPGGHAEAFVSIHDTGIGIDAAFLPHLFQEFKQASWGIKRSHEGNGLGLAITQRLVHLMAGHITVESEAGRGSTFTVFLPVAKAPLPSEAPHATEDAAAASLALSHAAR
ncbi:MAG: PAS domain S-box protein [Rhodothermaceae bacterium]|nr:PAS domain S-box protein [Rhodothermaceae bacterium]